MAAEGIRPRPPAVPAICPNQNSNQAHLPRSCSSKVCSARSARCVLYSRHTLSARQQGRGREGERPVGTKRQRCWSLPDQACKVRDWHLTRPPSHDRLLHCTAATAQHPQHSSGAAWQKQGLRPQVALMCLFLSSPDVRTARWLSLSGCHPICSTRRPGRLANSSASSTTASHTSCTAWAFVGATPPRPPGVEPCAGLVGASGAGRQLVKSTTTTRLISGSSRALPATAAYVPERLSAKCAAVSSSGGEDVSVRMRRGAAAPSAFAPP